LPPIQALFDHNDAAIINIAIQCAAKPRALMKRRANPGLDLALLGDMVRGEVTRN
jgi:hypothetical protein